MSLAGLIIIGLVVCVVVGPIMMLRPSPYQRRIAQWRQRANQRGFQIRILTENDTSCAEYALPWASKRKRGGWVLRRKHYAHDFHFLDYWEWGSTSRPSADMLPVLKTFLNAVPASASRVEATPAGVGCCWKEQGGEDEFESLLSALEALIRDEASLKLK